MIERRRHFVYLTGTSEYHLRDGICVAVRRRGDEGFVRGHLCEQRALREPAALGAPVVFEGCVVTPAILSVHRPPRGDVDRYALSA